MRFLNWIKQRFNRGSLRGKLILLFLLVSLIPLVVLGVIAYSLSQNALEVEAFNELETVRNLKAAQIETYFESVDQDILLLAELPILEDAMKDLGDQMFFRTGRELRKIGLLNRPDLSTPIRYHPYGLVHALYHPFFSQVAEANGYADIILVSVEGEIAYTQAKRNDFGTNLLTGPYKNSLLAEHFRNLRANPQPGAIQMTDYGFYTPMHGTPVSFVGTPVIDTELGGVIGFLIYALPLDPLNQLVVENTGLRTVNTYLVGSDGMMRSGLGDFGEMVDNPAVKAGLNNRIGIREIGDGEQALFTAYQPIKVADLNWVLVTEETRETATAGAGRLGGWILLSGIGAVGLVIVAGLAAGLWIASPISHLTQVARRVTGGDLAVQAPVERQDETGELAEAFNTMTAQLRRSIGSLEEQVQERTSELALSMEVGQRAATIRDINLLLPTVTEFIWDQFGLYYVQVFMVDDVGENLVLRAGAGPIGERLLAAGRTLSLKKYVSMMEEAKMSLAHGRLSRIPTDYYDSIIGYVAAEGKPLVVSDTNDSRFFKPDPLLPETRSELAIPLLVEGRVIGVLDMQDDKVNTFTSENLTVFEAMAVQLSISIDSARQWAIAQEAQQRAERAVQQLTREAWAEKLVSSQHDEGFVYDLSNITPLSRAGGALDAAVSVPLVVQDQAIGHLAVKASDHDLNEDEQALLRAVAQQLAQKAENLRLFEATQQRASREQIARRIIDKVRASRNIETALRTATEELNKALRTGRVLVDLNIPDSELEQPSPPEEPAESAAETPEQVGNGKFVPRPFSTKILSEPEPPGISDNGEDNSPPAETF